MPVTGGTFGFNNSGFQVTVSNFEMTRSEITVAQYKACVTASTCQAPTNTNPSCTWNQANNDTLPINCVSYDNAVTLAAWMDGQDANNTVRLPSETEWEYAAKSQGQNHTFVGGHSSLSCQTTTASVQGAGDTGPCGRTFLPPVCTTSTDLSSPSTDSDTAQDICNMSGSVEEYVRDTFVSRFSQIPANSLNDYLNGEPFLILPNYFNVLRGGSWRSTKSSTLKTTSRRGSFFTSRSHNNGIRLVRSSN
jgi:formylglycine-generating enzyme required for sulfatase activity